MSPLHPGEATAALAPRASHIHEAKLVRCTCFSCKERPSSYRAHELERQGQALPCRHRTATCTAQTGVGNEGRTVSPRRLRTRHERLFLTWHGA
ncbi:hypothetical protein AKJ09_08855 [Labilithrix luteola]|uniref:Uncharacterized protein n=1 Tax=Labilithrix luteola TaxID=1391654 RepID=A0A0K1Q933_9BACT|nr:hypothetical protein AKJ09_08855 [Labilithrix luteola]